MNKIRLSSSYIFMFVLCSVWLCAARARTHSVGFECRIAKNCENGESAGFGSFLFWLMLLYSQFFFFFACFR